MKPVVSVIITHFNLGEYLPTALESLAVQTLKECEFIVVDDGSTDKRSQGIYLKLKEKYRDDKRFNFIEQKNTGLPRARNNGIKVATGEFISVLDSDDAVAPEFLSTAVKELQTNNDTAIVTSYVERFGMESGVSKPPDPLKFVDVLRRNPIHVGSVFRKQGWEKVGGYPESFTKGYEDWAFWIELLKLSGQVIVLPEPFFKYRIRPNSMLSGSRRQHREIFADLVRHNSQLYIEYLPEIVEHQQELFNNVKRYRAEQLEARESAIEKLEKKLHMLNNDLANYKTPLGIADKVTFSEVTSVLVIKIRQKIKWLLMQFLQSLVRLKNYRRTSTSDGVDLVKSKQLPVVIEIQDGDVGLLPETLEALSEQSNIDFHITHSGSLFERAKEVGLALELESKVIDNSKLPAEIIHIRITPGEVPGKTLVETLKYAFNLNDIDGYIDPVGNTARLISDNQVGRTLNSTRIFFKRYYFFDAQPDQSL